MSFKYLVTDKDGTARLIEAKSPTGAIAHCAKDVFTAERVSEQVAGLLNIKVEHVGVDGPPELDLQSAEAPKAKGKAA